MASPPSHGRRKPPLRPRAGEALERRAAIVLCLVLFYAGLRRAETTALVLGDIEGSEGRTRAAVDTAVLSAPSTRSSIATQMSKCFREFVHSCAKPFGGSATVSLERRQIAGHAKSWMAEDLSRDCDVGL